MKRKVLCVILTIALFVGFAVTTFAEWTAGENSGTSRGYGNDEFFAEFKITNIISTGTCIYPAIAWQGELPVVPAVYTNAPTHVTSAKGDNGYFWVRKVTLTTDNVINFKGNVQIEPIKGALVTTDAWDEHYPPDFEFILDEGIYFFEAFGACEIPVSFVIIVENKSSISPASPHKVGDPLGDVVYSDITAYINGQAIPTSIKNGTTMVVVEDLANYGFDVKWDGKARTLKVELAKNKKFTPLPVVKDTKNKPGTFKCKYVYTDIKTYISGKEVESYAIAGVTLIDFELLKQYGTLSWNGKTREIKIEISTNTANINNTVSVDPKGLKKYSYTKFNYTFEWGEKSHLAQINKNAVGECILSFKVEGDLTGITAVRIANWQQNSFTEDAIKNITDKMVSAWKQSSQKLPDHKFDGNGQYGFPVNEDMRGKTFEVLLIALDKDLNPLGYIIVSVKIPAK